MNEGNKVFCVRFSLFSENSESCYYQKLSTEN